MPLTRIEAENFTVFEDITIPFSKGLNVLVGENGMGKTHIMKLSYDNLRTRAAVTVRGTAEVEEKSPMELLKEFYELQNNQPMTDEQEEIARGMMEEIWEDER